MTDPRASLSAIPAAPAPARPQLLVVVDTEEEFDWSRPLARENVGTRSVRAQAAAHALYDRHGVVPTYVVGYPVAADPEAAAFFAALRDAGKAEIGAHLHSWVTPPHDEAVDIRNSYQCNLPPVLERAKIARLTDRLTAAFGARPTVFKAGRNGFGPGTARALAGLGYGVDCSLLPYTDLSADGGPDFRGLPDQPFWLDAPGGLLEVPMTIGFIGALASAGPRVQRLFDHRGARAVRLPGLLARGGLVARSRLTPESVSAKEQCRLLEALAERGRRVFSLVYHSPSLAPGHTPYVRSEEDLAAFLGRLDAVLDFFVRRLGGEFTTLTRLRGRYDESAGRRAA